MFSCNNGISGTLEKFHFSESNYSENLNIERKQQLINLAVTGNYIVRVRRKKPHSANRKKPIFDKRKEPKLPESDLLFRVIQAVPLQEQPLFF
jgi:hypothetical protein